MYSISSHLDEVQLVEDGRRPHAEVVRDEGEEAVGGVQEAALVAGVVVDHVLEGGGTKFVSSLTFCLSKNFFEGGEDE